MMWFRVYLVLLLIGSVFVSQIFSGRGSRREEVNFDTIFRVDHPFNAELLAKLQDCEANQWTTCPHSILTQIYTLSAKIANEHCALLLYDRAQHLFEDILYFLQKDSSESSYLRSKSCHILSVLAFAHGNIRQVSY